MAVLIATIAAGGAYAQTLDEIIVTAQKREQSIQDVSASVAAVTGEELSKISAASFEDYYRLIPNLMVVDQQVGRNNIIIRGIETDSQGDTAVSQVYWDEVPIGASVQHPDIHSYDLNRVEVLRGPQGTLYGASSLGGAVKLVPNAPDMEGFAGEIDLMGSHTSGLGGSNHEVNVMLNIPLSDSIGVRFVAFDRHEDGYGINLASNNPDPSAAGSVGEESNSGGRLYVRYAGERAQVDFQWINQRAKSKGEHFFYEFFPKFTQDVLFPTIRFDDTDIFNLKVNYDFNNVSLISSTAYIDRETGIQDEDFTLSAIFGDPPDIYGDLYLPYKTFVQEARFASNNDNPFQWVVGAYFEDFERNVVFTDLLYPTGELDFMGEVDQFRKNYALFGEASYELTDKLIATVGYRTFKFEDREEAFGDVLETENDDDIWKFNLAYAQSDDVLLFLNVAQGYRRGDFAPIIEPGCEPFMSAANGGTLPGPVQPDSLWNYEIGTKATFFEGRLQANATLYHIDWDDIQVVIDYASPPDLGCENFKANGGKAKARGAEFEFVAAPSENWLLGLNVAFTNNELRDAVSFNNPLLDGFPGDKLPATPKRSYSTSAEYSFEAFSKDAFIRAEASHIGGSYYGFRPLDFAYAGDYTIANFRAGLSADSWEATIFVNNLTDDDSISYVNIQPVVDTDGAIGTFNYRLRPRTAGVTFKYRF